MPNKNIAIGRQIAAHKRKLAARQTDLKMIVRGEIFILSNREYLAQVENCLDDIAWAKSGLAHWEGQKVKN
jgi:hypothetical protein